MVGSKQWLVAVKKTNCQMESLAGKLEVQKLCSGGTESKTLVGCLNVTYSELRIITIIIIIIIIIT